MGVELLLSAICIIPYTHRLYKIYKYMKQMDKEPDDKQHVILYNVIQKQCKLAFVLYGTSFMLFAVLSNVIRQRGIVQSFGYMDTIINGLCVYCTFDFTYNKFLYRYLCNCNGIKSLQIMFCFCCWKCNESEEEETDEMRLSEMQSNNEFESKSTTKPSQNVNLDVSIDKRANNESGSIPTATSIQSSIDIVYDEK